jgi:LmbE family N-acetylglucosaminyl deacetylase
MKLDSIDEITPSYKHIVLQPHFDDGALSCGGTLAYYASHGVQCLTITVFGGTGTPTPPLSTFGREIHAAMGFNDSIEKVVSTRRREDSEACKVLGVDYLWLAFPEALYRGYESSNSLFSGELNDSDTELTGTISAIISNILSMASSVRLYAPLGLGNHVDHKLVSLAARALMGGDNHDICFFEDFPYATIAGSFEQVTHKGFEQDLMDISSELNTKVDAILRYRSQVPFLFSTLLHETVAPGAEQDRLREIVKQYSSSLRSPGTSGFFERFWTSHKD